jgi:hypothetical protein
MKYSQYDNVGQSLYIYDLKLVKLTISVDLHSFFFSEICIRDKTYQQNLTISTFDNKNNDH